MARIGMALALGALVGGLILFGNRCSYAQRPTIPR